MTQTAHGGSQYRIHIPPQLVGMPRPTGRGAALAVAALLILTYLGVSDLVDAINKGTPPLDLDGDGIVGPDEPGYVTPTGGSR